MRPFQYHEPTCIEDACRLLEEHRSRACLIAGGTDLVIRMKRGVLRPEHVIDIQKIDTLKGVTKSVDGYKIGAATTLADIVENDDLKADLQIICSAASMIGSIQVRNLATIGGNLCNAAPSADMAPGLLVLDASVTIVGCDSEKTVPLHSFFNGPGETCLKTGELVKEILIPMPPKGMDMIYLKHGPRQAMDCAVVGVGCGLLFDEKSGNCTEARIALGAVAPTPVRAARAERLIVEKPLSDFSTDLIAKAIGKDIAPISDVRASAEYRLIIASTLAIRAIRMIAKTS
jgi:carbon-monoxide dehydrogenase medium subunit